MDILRCEKFKNGFLWNADCLDALRHIDKFDICVTSPPYNLNKEHSGSDHTESGRRMLAKYDAWYFDDMPEPEYQAWQVEVIKAIMAKCGGSIFYNHRIRYAWHSRNKHRTPSNIYHPLDWLSQFPIWAEIIWDRLGAGTPNNRVNLRHEYVYQINRPAGGDLTGESSVWPISPEREDRNGHVCPFPVALVSKCLKIGSDPGQTVFDPFMGSGTTAVAAIRAGRRFLGAELDKETFERACERIHKEESQGTLF